MATKKHGVLKKPRGRGPCDNEYTSDKYAQILTHEDCSDYGNWISPFDLKLACYAEGEITVITCDDEEDFVRELQKRIKELNSVMYYIQASDNVQVKLIELGFSTEVSLRYASDLFTHRRVI